PSWSARRPGRSCTAGPSASCRTAAASISRSATSASTRRTACRATTTEYHAMRPALAESVPERIRRLGFRRWHERTLIVAHGWLVGCFVAMIFAAAGFELLSLGDGIPEFLFDALLIAAAATLGWQAWRRYRVSM